MLEKVVKRLKRQARVKAKISSSTNPRLNIYRSNCYIYAQIIDQETWKIICASNNLKDETKTTKVESSKKVWADIAKKAIENKITEVVFDRNWFAYHWRVKALADAAREAWLKF